MKTRHQFQEPRTLGARPRQYHSLGLVTAPDSSRWDGAQSVGIGFTLIELLAVIAIIGVLAALILPTAASARSAANRTKSRVQFSQWASAIEAFRQEYGYYPAFDPTGKVNGGATTQASAPHLFHDTLAGRHRDGSALTGDRGSSPGTLATPEMQNPRHIAFIGFGDADIYSDACTELALRNLLHDAYGNTDLAVLVDRNLDGKIDAADYPALPDVSPLDNSTVSLHPSIEDFPRTGVRVGVIFYSAPPKALDASQLVLSWR